MSNQEPRPSPEITTDDLWPRVSIRGIDPELWDRIRVAAVRRRLPVGEVVNGAMAHWLASNEPPLAQPIATSNHGPTNEES